jgi:hypothetical protein
MMKYKRIYFEQLYNLFNFYLKKNLIILIFIFFDFIRLSQSFLTFKAV